VEKAPPTKRPHYDTTFRAKALRLANKSYSTLTATCVLNIDPKRFYTLQKSTQQPLPTGPTEVAKVRILRLANKTYTRRLATHF
jgi:transposase